MAAGTVRIDGLAEFRAAIKKVDKGHGKALRQAHLRVAKLVGDRAKDAAPKRAASGIKPKATQKEAAIRTTPGRRGDALGVIWGMKKRSGWYGYSRYDDSTGRQFEPWVGNQYEPGSAAGKPYFIGDAINNSIDEVIDIFGEEIERLAKQAFPD